MLSFAVKSAEMEVVPGFFFGLGKEGNSGISSC